MIVRSINRKLAKVKRAMVNDEQRKAVIFVCFNVIMGLVSLCMSVVNIFTKKWLLMCITLAFSLACALNVIIFTRGGKGRRISMYLFLAEGVIICGFFCISGIPEGFSALWTCFIPSYTLTLLGKKKGSFYAGLTFLMVGFLFWTPLGRSLLQYDYTESFKLRFPMIYVAFFAMALLLEAVRSETQRQLMKAEMLYQHLYKHDALTGILNRYGFNERVNEVYGTPDVKSLSMFIMDLDLFKNVNDTYGHDGGDVVLCHVAGALCRLAGKEADVCRWGGEEFTVLLRDHPDPEGLAEHIRQELERTVIRSGSDEIRITVSIGVCTVEHREKTTIAQMVKSADQCLYRAKETGRNRVEAVRL